jgi:hypothetical protein
MHHVARNDKLKAIHSLGDDFIFNDFTLGAAAAQASFSYVVSMEVPSPSTARFSRSSESGCASLNG